MVLVRNSLLRKEILNYQPSAALHDPVRLRRNLEEVFSIAQVQAEPENYNIKSSRVERKTVGRAPLRFDTTV